MIQIDRGGQRVSSIGRTISRLSLTTGWLMLLACGSVVSSQPEKTLVYVIYLSEGDAPVGVGLTVYESGRVVYRTGEGRLLRARLRAPTLRNLQELVTPLESRLPGPQTHGYSPHEARIQVEVGTARQLYPVSTAPAEVMALVSELDRAFAGLFPRRYTRLLPNQ